MSLIDPEVGDLFRIRAFGNLIAAPAKEYNNSIDIQVVGAATTENIQQLAYYWVDFLGRQTYDVFEWTRFTVSTWAPDSDPYDPFSFMTGDVVVPPTPRTSTGHLMPAEAVLSLRKEVLFGRQGKVALRFAVQEDEVFAPSGTISLTNAAGFVTRLDSALTLSHLAEYFAGGVEPLRVVVVSNVLGVPVPRDVVAMSVDGAAMHKANHKYFDLGGSASAKRAGARRAAAGSKGEVE